VKIYYVITKRDSIKTLVVVAGE